MIINNGLGDTAVAIAQGIQGVPADLVARLGSADPQVRGEALVDTLALAGVATAVGAKLGQSGYAALIKAAEPKIPASAGVKPGATTAEPPATSGGAAGPGVAGEIHANDAGGAGVSNVPPGHGANGGTAAAGELTRTRTAISAADDAATIRSLTRENESATTLANNCYKVQQNPPTLPNSKNPDYIINGQGRCCITRN
ncbi:MAG: hypothetical protein ACRYGA_13065 [Janthinobacterium lividum]